ncbi:MAG TPA: PEP-CTERM sorting domain-containing protein [Myxococcota bacterium]
MQKIGNRIGRGGWRAWSLALLAASSLPTAASATVFSFGTINPTDVITSLSFAASTVKTSFDPGTSVMHVEAYLSQINFSNRPNISGIAPNTVLLMSDIVLVPGSFAISFSDGLVAGPDTIFNTNPRSTSATFTNGLVDLGIFDTIGGIPLLDTDYFGSLGFSAAETGSVNFPQPITGQLSADLVVLPTSDPDFLSAFGPAGELDANFSGFFSDAATVANNLCNLVRTGVGTYGAQECNGAYSLDDFTTNAIITIIPIPEPGTALLLGLGLAGVAALRRK